MSPRTSRPFVLGVLAAWSAVGQVPVGTEFQVNTYTTGEQTASAVARSGETVFVVVWSSANQDHGIFGQRFADEGGRLGNEFQVNSETGGSQSQPAISSSSAGDFIVVWRSKTLVWTPARPGPQARVPVPTESRYAIKGRRYDSAGLPVGGEFQTNTNTIDVQGSPAVANQAEGGFLVVWDSDGADSGAPGILAQRYGIDGEELGDEFVVSTSSTGSPTAPDVAIHGDGGFVVVWQSEGEDGSEAGLFGQVLLADGSLEGDRFQVNSWTTGAQRGPRVAAQKDRGFVVVWSGPAPDGSPLAAMARLFDQNGSALGSDFIVDAQTTVFEQSLAVAADASGYFVVLWEDCCIVEVIGVRGRRFSPEGAPLSEAFLVDWYAHNPALVRGANGDFVVTWSDGPEHFPDEILGRRYSVNGRVGDRVWRDLDLDGLQDDGEPGIEGASVHLFDRFGLFVDTTQTDSAGFYSFAARSDEYYLRFEAPRSLSFTLANRLANDDQDSDADPSRGETETFLLKGNDHLENWDAGMANGLGDRIWHDENEDGFQDVGEPGLPGLTVSLFDETGLLLSTTRSDRDGLFGFSELSPGRYYLAVSLPSGGTSAPRDQGSDDLADSDINGKGQTRLIDLPLGALDRSWDAGVTGSYDVLLGSIFADAFESGDLTAWNALVRVHAAADGASPSGL